MADAMVTADGTLSFEGKAYQCALGWGGVRQDKREGDGATPVGCFPVLKVFYRADRLKAAPRSVFPTAALSEHDAWSDDVSCPEYNTHVTLPYEGSHEKLWRSDCAYDIVVALGYNDAPALPGKGSAIFMHVSRDGYPPTDGCVALAESDLLALLAVLGVDSRICIESQNG